LYTSLIGFNSRRLKRPKGDELPRNGPTTVAVCVKSFLYLTAELAVASWVEKWVGRGVAENCNYQTDSCKLPTDDIIGWVLKIYILSLSFLKGESFSHKFCIFWKKISHKKKFSNRLQF